MKNYINWIIVHKSDQLACPIWNKAYSRYVLTHKSIKTNDFDGHFSKLSLIIKKLKLI